MKPTDENHDYINHGRSKQAEIRSAIGRSESTVDAHQEERTHPPVRSMQFARSAVSEGPL
jgi:hypothetical protein